jgi:hypothetical protein
MPNLARGTHAFRPSLQTSGAAHTTVDLTNDTDNPGHGSDSDPNEDLPPPSSTPPHPPVSSPTVTCVSTPASISSTSASSLSKRKRSALDDSESAQSSGSRKFRNTIGGGAVALNGIKESIESFNVAFCDSVSNRPATQSERKRKAMDLLQESEPDLDDRRLIAIMNLFKVDADAADMYIAMRRESTRKAWLQSQFDQLGLGDEGAS